MRDGEDQNSIVELTAKYGDNLAQQVENLSNYLDRKDIKEMARDVEVLRGAIRQFLSARPFALGFLAVRFLKSSSPNQALAKYSENGEDKGNKTLLHQKIRNHRHLKMPDRRLSYGSAASC